MAAAAASSGAAAGERIALGQNNTQIISFDVTISIGEGNAPDDVQQVGKRLAELFKKFVFQKEQGANGFVHFQVRGQTHKQSGAESNSPP